MPPTNLFAKNLLWFARERARHMKWARASARGTHNRDMYVRAARNANRVIVRHLRLYVE